MHKTVKDIASKFGYRVHVVNAPVMVILKILMYNTAGLIS